MASLTLDENLVSALDRVCNKDDILKKVRQKVESLLRHFASTKKVSYKKLRIIDIATAGGGIQPPLLRMIQSAPCPPGRTEKRHRRYMSENASCVMRLIRETMGLRPTRKEGAKSSPESLLLKQIPDFLKSILDKFPRAQPHKTCGKGKIGNPISSLTPNGQLLLLSLCKVARTIDIRKESAPLNCLLINHVDLVNAQLHAVTSSVTEYRSCYGTLQYLLRKIGLRREAREAVRMKVEDWPEPLRSEYLMCLQLASGEIEPSQSLLESASQYKFSVRLGEGSIESSTTAICQLIRLIPQNESLSITDLIRLEPTEVKTQEGTKTQNRNYRIDQVREIERAKQTPSKRAGYDSELFRRFLYAVKMIAARSGYGHLIKAFNEAYQIRRDLETRKAKKDAKKRGITRKWVDKELSRLGAEFDRIVKKGLFKRSKGRSKSEADRAMRLCLFYPQILTKRLLGYRQQAIRQCTAVRNIEFMSDGTVILHFNQDEVKNKRELHMEIKPTEEGTHERLRTVLIMYNQKVLPYAKKQGGSKLGQRFFGQFDGKTGQFRGFNDAADYEQFFKDRVREFLNIQELESDMQDALNPHFLRGMCTDWMILDLHMSIWEAAEVLGDTVKVVEKDYLDRNRVYDATKPFDRVNAERLRAKKELDEQLSKKDQQIERLTNSLDIAMRQLNNLTTQLAAIHGANITIGVNA